MMKRLAAYLLLTLMTGLFPVFSTFFGAPHAMAASCSGAKVATRAAADFMRAGQSGSPAALERAMKKHVHVRRVMLFALGRHAHRLSPAQKRAYVRRATRYAARQLAQVGRNVRGGRVQVVSCRGNRVITRVGDNKVIWKVRGRRIVDVNFRGMWVAPLLRSHFRKMLREANNDMKTFLARLN